MSRRPPHRATRLVLTSIAIGLAAGLLSGLFGVGGGTVIVPMLVLLLRFDQRLAVGTSLAAIVPTAAVGVLAYAFHDAVAWIPALILAAAAVVGAQIGAWLLPRVPQNALRWGFVGFLVLVIVMLFVTVPTRGSGFALSAPTGIGLVVLGVATGVASALLGVGGGIVVVPVLILVFTVDDLVAKGTSLMTMIPTAISGTVGNLVRRNVDLLVAATVGLSASTTTALGATLASGIDPAAGNVLFAVFLTYVSAQMAVRALRRPRRSDPDTPSAR